MKLFGFPALRITILTLLFGAGSIIVSTEPLHADVNIERHNNGSVWIDIVNTISKNDANYIAQRSPDFENASVDVRVRLSSSGGDVDAAMQIGRIIRTNEASVSVGQNAKCYSSCALLYIAGVRRVNFGTIGLHRPYLSAAPQSRQAIERGVPLMLQQLKGYVQEMGLTDNFYQEMVNAEPSNIKLYVGDNINRLVPETDPTYDEIQISYRARRYGIR